MRILVTGSRDWPNPERVDELICEALTGWQMHPVEPGSVVVHGACPRGADEHAAQAVRRLAAGGWTVTEERHPADWNAHGKSAGFRRNAEMVNLGADICLAFIKAGSRGASHTAGLAERAGIETLREVLP